MTMQSPHQSGRSHERLASLQHLLIDGHNVLFGCSPLFGHYKAPEFPGSAHRQQLIEAGLALSQSFPHLHIQLWFDGLAYAESHPTDRFRVLYSGGEGRGRADREIISSLARLKAAGGQPRGLVTADKALSRKARKLGALILLPDDFAEILAKGVHAKGLVT
jgi:hypothetical protein